MSGYRSDQGSERDVRMRATRARNRRTGLILASIALVFFVGIIVKYTMR